MKRKILFVLILLCGIFVYAGPFGLSMGMTYDEVQEACGGRAPERIENDDRYYIVPEKSHSMFKIYIAWISDEYGLYYIKAISDEVYTSDYGTEAVDRFYPFKNRLASIYGEPELFDGMIDKNSFLCDDNYWMSALRDGARQLYARWTLDNKKVHFKDNLIFVYFGVNYFDSEHTYFILEYAFENQFKVDQQEDDVL